MQIGLVSDTHYPERCRQLPTTLFNSLEGADLVLHAGDVGDLVVLDCLSEIAPVVAVHGNDDSSESRSSLPYMTVVVASGIRILLWHSHYEDRQQEFDSRQEDDILPKLERIAEMAHRFGASIAVFGHWHIPLTRKVDGVLVINPGAVASGNVVTRQVHQTVARLKISGDRSTQVTHIDLAQPRSKFEPAINWNAGFTAILQRFSSSIFAPDVLAELNTFLGIISQEDQEQLRLAIYHLAQRCWSGQIDAIDLNLLRRTLEEETRLS